MYYAVLLISFFVIFLLIRLSRFTFYKLAENSLELVNILMDEIDEDLKIKQVQKKTNSLVFALLKMFLVIILSFALGGIPIAIYCIVTKTAFQSLEFFSFYPILFISIGATIPFIIPLGKKEKSSYSELSQLLHRMALNNYNISKKLLKREERKIRKRNLSKRQDFVIVSGLARAGTTSLLNDLSEINTFVSLNYANMPFVTAPNLWRKFYKPKAEKLKERSHKDGIMIGYNSNEALEEYFFKIKTADSFIKDDYLAEHNISQKTYDDYLKYQSIIKLDDKKIYLAKNNNFILRYKSIRGFNDKFIMVIMFRNPLTHAASLMEKHKDYKKLQKQDPFVLEYMNWLGHHEFGINQKPFVFENNYIDIEEDKSHLTYWLKIWINYYKNVLTIDHPNTIFINYDTYCREPKKTINRILKKTGIDRKTIEYKPFENKRKSDENIPEDLNKEAQEIYLKLITKSNQ